MCVYVHESKPCIHLVELEIPIDFQWRNYDKNGYETIFNGLTQTSGMQMKYIGGERSMDGRRKKKENERMDRMDVEETRDKKKQYAKQESTMSDFDFVCFGIHSECVCVCIDEYRTHQ